MPVNPIFQKTKHVVVLMLENRGFDHFMGWLYDRQNPPRHSFPDGAVVKVPRSQQGLRPFEGLDGLEQAIPQAVENRYQVTDGTGHNLVGALYPHRGARSAKAPSVNPLEDFIHIFEQMYRRDHAAMSKKETREAIVKERNPQGQLVYRRPPMNGFVQSFANALEEHAKKQTITPDDLSEIMDTYTPEQLPVLAGLARHYAVSDMWFCSVPSQTNTNRAYSLAGTARGMVTNNFYDPKGQHADSMPAGTRSLFTLLENHDVDWAYFWSKKWPPVIGDQYARKLVSDLKDAQFDANFPGIADFYRRAQAGTLPAVSFIEPEWGGGKAWTPPSMSPTDQRLVGNEYHPACDTTTGEMFVKKVYDHLTRLPDGRVNPKWAETLLLITFDENGGTYDHFPPPPAVPSGRDDAPSDYKQPDMDPGTHSQFGFEFDLFGVRVPTIIVSPYVAAGTVFRSPTDVPFDHTSIIATILKWQGVTTPEWNQLGNRVANAPAFDDVLTLQKPRDDIRYGVTPARAHGARPLTYGANIHLRYIGDPANPQGAQYIGAAERSGLYYYPRFAARKQDAVKLQLKGSGQGRIKNGAMVHITNPDMNILTGNTLSAPQFAKNVYYSTLGVGGNWQIWLAANRDEDEEIYEGDEVIFLSQVAIQRPLFDPYQRLLPDSKAPQYMTIEAGEWAAWRLETP